MVFQGWLDSFLMTFIPLFIVIDAIGNLPFVIVLSEGMVGRERRRFIIIATVTALIVGLVFLFLGSFILMVMGISVGAFAIAGGIILLVFSIQYMSTGRMVEVAKEEMVAVVPIGTPLTAGPAALTTLLLLATQYPMFWVLVSYLANMLIVCLTLVFSNQIVRVLGQGGIKAFSKVAALLLAAIAVNMALRGLEMLGIVSLSG